MNVKTFPLVAAGLITLGLAACSDQAAREKAADAEAAAASAAQSADQAAQAAGTAAGAAVGAATTPPENTTTVIREVPAEPAPTTKQESTSVTVDGTGATVSTETKKQ